MAISEGTAYYFLNDSNQVVMKVQWVDPPTSVIYVKPNGTAAPTGGYPPADDSVAFTLYSDGSLESYRSLGGDGSFTWLKFAQADPGAGKSFGPNSEYSHGDLIFSETLTRAQVDSSPALVHKVQSFEDGNLTSFEFSYGMPDNSSAVVTGSYDPTTGVSTVTLTNLDHPTPISNTGPGFINSLSTLTAQIISRDGAGLIGNDGGTLIGNDGSTLIGNDGGTLNQRDVAALIGNDSAGLIGNDGSTLINFGGGGNSIIGPAYSAQNGQLVGNDGSTLIGTDGATLAANALASFRGYSAYSLSSFESDADPSVDTLAADATTSGALDIFGVLRGELETAGDHDWIKVELKAGETYVITANADISQSNGLANPELKLFDANGVALAEDSDGGVGENARLVFTALADGAYFVDVGAAGETGVGAYELGVHSQPTSFVKDGATINNITGAGFLLETSITALGDGGFAIGFTSRIDGYWDSPFNQSFHAHVEVINAQGQVVDLDPRADYSTFSIYRGGDYNNLPGATEVVMNADGGFSVIVPNTYPIETGMIYRAVVAHGSELGLGPVHPLTPDSTSTFKTYATYAVDIALLANGSYIASMGAGGIHGTDTTGDMVQISINGALPITIDSSTGINSNGQRTSVSALGNGAVVVWTDAQADPSGANGGGNGVQGAIVDALGNVLHTFDVNQTEERSQFVDSGQAVAELADGGFVVAWASKEEDPNLADPYTDSYFRVFNADGTARTGEILLGDNQAQGQNRPVVVGLPSGGFAIAWSDFGNLRLQQFDDFGAEMGVETAIGFGGNLSLAVGAHGKLAVSYTADGMLRVQIMEPNHAPTDILLSNNSIEENLVNAPADVIGSLAAVDQNASDTFTYELIDNADGAFRLDGAKVYWNRYGSDPDFEAQSSYDMKVRATDSAKTSVVKTLTINVTDVNEAVIGLKGAAFASLEENSAAGTVIATLAGDDPDVGETFTYALVDGGEKPFALVGNQLKLTGPLDYEQASSHVLTVRITDSADHVVDKQFTVYVDDIDDAAPTTLQLYSDHIDENADAGTAIGSIFALDPDTYSGLEYELRGANASLFELKEQSGTMWLYARDSFNHEATPTVDVTIRVKDGGGRHLDKKFTIQVDDLNDLPVITSANGFKVSEDQERIVKLAATDQDGDPMTWTVEPSQGSFVDFFAFEVDSSGYLTLAPNIEADAPSDTDKDGVYHFRVTANDGGWEDVSQDMTVTVVGGNADPVISGGLNSLVKLKENQATAKTIVATDADGDKLSYSIVGGPDSGLFKLNTSHGKTQLVFKNAPDYENPADLGRNNTYNVIIRVNDGHGGIADQAVAIAVQNVKGVTFSGTKAADIKSGGVEEDFLSGLGKDDKLDGKGGNDTLNGGLGKDRLTGGSGRDVFIFDTKPTQSNMDTVTDFSVADDQFRLELDMFSNFAKAGHLSKTAFTANNAGIALDKDDRIIYEKDSGELLFDADGSRSKFDAILFAKIDKNLALTYRDFDLI